MKRVAVVLLALAGSSCARVARPAAETDDFCSVGWYTVVHPESEAALNPVVKAFAEYGMELGRELRLYGSHGASVYVPCSLAADAREILHGLDDGGVIRYDPDAPR